MHKKSVSRLKKRWIIVLVAIVAIVAVVVAITMPFWRFCAKVVEEFIAAQNEPMEDNYCFRPSESYYVGYELTDHNTVKVYYSICMVNEYDKAVYYDVSVFFKESELRGWMKPEQLFGIPENGELTLARVEPHSKQNYVFVFEGEYLGGPVNEKLSFPRMVIPLYWFADDYERYQSQRAIAYPDTDSNSE